MVRQAVLLFQCLLAVRTAVVSAWVAPLVQPSTRSSISRSSSGLLVKATVEEGTTAKTTTTSSSTSSSAHAALSPPYAAALDKALQKLTASIPEKYAPSMLPLLSHFVEEYISANQKGYETSSNPAKKEVCGPEAAANRILTAVKYGLTYGMPNSPTKFSFDVSHEAFRGRDLELEDGNTIDFYEFGCAFFRSCMDLENSVTLGKDNVEKMLKQLEAGENVVFLANHQSEADPQVVSCLLETMGLGEEASKIVYVAGHKVTTDPLAIPFSMGRSLICIHSKKHISVDPATKAVKQQQNMRSIGALLNKFKEGGTWMWVAPSGGRDRRDVETGKVPLAEFDSKTVDVFRLYGNKSKKPTHFYTLAMVTYDLCPPPDYIVPGVGEERNVRFVPVGIAIGNEVESHGGLESRHEFTAAAQEQCQRDYERLLEALKK